MYQQLRALLTASLSFQAAVKPGNRIWLVKEQGDEGSGLFPFKDSTQDADYPESCLVIGEGTGEPEARTFAMFAAGSSANYLWMWNQVYVLTLTLPDLRVEKATALTAIVMAALLKQGPKFGKDYVFKFGPFKTKHSIVASKISEEGKPQGSQRYVVHLEIPITFRLDSRSLTS